MSDIRNLGDYDAQESEMTGWEDRTRVGRDIAMLVAGAAIGAGLALLFAPMRGDEVRDAIGRGYRRTVEGLSERARDLRERASDLRERAPNLLGFGRRRGDRRRAG